MQTGLGYGKKLSVWSYMLQLKFLQAYLIKQHFYMYSNKYRPQQISVKSCDLPSWSKAQWFGVTYKH